MNLIAKLQFGSHVYGTNLPTSDQDWKGIYLPEPKDIILQRVKDNYTLSTKTDNTKKNGPEDVDTEIFSLQEYLRLLMEGQTVAVDILFTPVHFYKEWKGYWMHEIWPNANKFLHKGTSSYVGYCRTQAAKYGLKGGRVATMRAAIELLKGLPSQDKLLMHWDAISAFTLIHEHTEITSIESKTLKIPMLHWDVCNCKMGQTVTVEYAMNQYQVIFDKYGERAKLAEKNEGVDWKALMHAVRVCEEAKELLLTHNITFPRPEKDLLLKIRQGQLPYKQVAEMIEIGLADVETAKLRSTLPEQPDKAFADELIYNIYMEIINKNQKFELWEREAQDGDA